MGKGSIEKEGDNSKEGEGESKHGLFHNVYVYRGSTVSLLLTQRNSTKKGYP